MSSQENREPAAAQFVKGEATRLGFDLVGICDVSSPNHLREYEEWLGKGFHGSMDYLVNHRELKRSPTQLLESTRSIIAVGLNYCQPNVEQPNQPHIASYALGRDYHRVLRGKLKHLADWIQREYPGSQSRACVDSAPILERDYANQAGLGWFGKNTCLINSQRGSWFFIGLLLTSQPFEADKPAIGGCGTCHQCVDSCPTGAIVFEEDRWQINASKCISYLTIEHKGPIEQDLASRMGGWTVGCDICQQVCPFNQPRDSQPLRATQTSEMDLLNQRRWPTLLKLSQISDADFDVLTRGSAVRRLGPENMKRNAKINLANES